jgi:hypothetical protein
MMKRNKFRAVALLSFALILILNASAQTRAQDTKPSYPTMAPLEQYLMGRDAEIALARSAAPPSVSRDATVAVLGSHGYETAVEGKNGFFCLVERSWMNPFDNPEFWNPKMRAPVCHNPSAVRSILPIAYLRTKMVLAGLSKAQIIDRLKTANTKNEFPHLEPGAMSYMLSSQGNLGDAAGHWLPHLMIYTPRADATTWGANLSDTPVALLPADPLDQQSVFLIPVGHWSDGTPAPAM